MSGQSTSWVESSTISQSFTDLEKGARVKFIFLFVLSVLYSCAAFAAPDINPAPHDGIEVIGKIPDDVEAVLVEDWYTTTNSMFCKHMVGEAGFMPDHFAKRVQLTSTSDGQRSWQAWRDDVKLGYCGWALRQIVVYLDSKTSGIDPLQTTKIPVRVAVDCQTGDDCKNTWGSNDDSEKPTYHRCSFDASTQSILDAGNPCSPRFFDEKTRGTDLGKYEHILRPNQHTVRFVITEVEKQNP